MTSKQTYAEYATAMWKHFDENERTGVRFGMFPADKMKNAESLGYNGRELCLALMNIAKHNGGMRA